MELFRISQLLYSSAFICGLEPVTP